MSDLDLTNVVFERAQATSEAKRLLHKYGTRVGETPREMFVIMVEQLVFARVLEDRLLTVLAESSAAAPDARLINEKILELAGEISAELIKASNLRAGARP
jgi:hypothetical protein